MDTDRARRTVKLPPFRTTPPTVPPSLAFITTLGLFKIDLFHADDTILD